MARIFFVSVDGILFVRQNSLGRFANFELFDQCQNMADDVSATFPDLHARQNWMLSAPPVGQTPRRDFQDAGRFRRGKKRLVGRKWSNPRISGFLSLFPAFAHLFGQNWTTSE